MARKQHTPDGLEAAGYKRADWSIDRRARWLLTFASVDLGRVTRRRLDKLYDDLAGFLWSTYAVQSMGQLSISRTDRRVRLVRPSRWIFTGSRIPLPSKATLMKWQRWLREGLARLGRQQPGGWVISPKGVAYYLERSGSKLLGHSVMKPASTHDWFRDFTYQTLAEARRLRFCDTCGRAFIRRGRQAYCSLKCSQKIRTQRYRSHHRQKVNERRRLAYGQKVQEKHGRNVRVTRRTGVASPEVSA